METRKIAIIGSGPAGYTAAIYAARANLAPVVFTGGPADSDKLRTPGGQLVLTTEVENYPGFPTGITGPELMDLFEKQAARFETTIHRENVTAVDFSARPFRIVSENHQYFAHSVVVATGAMAKWTDAKGEAQYRNHGVSACATCDGFFFRGKPVLVVGGGDTAMEEALYLAKLSTEVTLIHRRSSLRASPIMQARAFAEPKLKFVWDSEVEEVLGDGTHFTGVRVRNLKTQYMSVLNAAGFFVAIGHLPVVDLISTALKLQPNGYLWVDPGTTRTSVKGVFGAGDVCDSKYRQAVTAAGLGCMAAIEAQHYLAEEGLA